MTASISTSNRRLYGVLEPFSPRTIVGNTEDVRSSGCTRTPTASTHVNSANQGFATARGFWEGSLRFLRGAEIPSVIAEASHSAADAITSALINRPTISSAMRTQRIWIMLNAYLPPPTIATKFSK